MNNMLTLHQVAEELGTTEAMVTNKLVAQGKLHAPITSSGKGINRQSLWKQEWVDAAKKKKSNRELHAMAFIGFKAVA